MKKKKVVIILSIILVLLIASLIGGLVLVQKHKEEERIKAEEKLLKDINSHYNEYVKTNKETTLYKKENNKYLEYGKINKDVSIMLNEEKINLDTKYFNVKDLNLYIKYEDVEKIDEYKKEDRYKNYIYFNQNITTKDKTSFYDKEGNYLYTLNKSFDFKVLVKETDSYGVICNDELLFVKHEDVEKIYDNNNTDLKNKNRIKTLTYHFLYDQEKEKCDQSICQSFEQFESHLKYIRENDYFTLKLNELEWYMDGKIQIPEKSIVLTIDDGTIFNTGAIKLLEEYDVNATLFVITGWVGTDHLQSPNLDLESHTDKMHNQYECKGYGSQGGGILCLDEEYVLNDLKTCQEKLGGSKYFAYPFFDFNDRAIALLKKAGYKLAFIGQYDTDGYSYPGVTDNFKIRRTTIFSDTSMEEFKSYLR